MTKPETPAGSDRGFGFHGPRSAGATEEEREMQDDMAAIEGIWLPLVTPFRNGALDEASLTRLLRHYLAEPVDGFILAATTGEALTLDDAETERLVSLAAEELSGGRPLWLGLSGSDTAKLSRRIEVTAGWPVDGYLATCPYYTRPSQEGLYRHFQTLAASTDRPLMLYNIPYRTGVNMANETLLRLAGIDNIVGLKDCAADAAQSFDLLSRRPDGFAVMTGEDALFYPTLVQGADGGILAAAHIETRAFAAVRAALVVGDWRRALGLWRDLVALPRLLFAEPSPAPIKHWLWRQGLIDSAEVRAPLTGVTPTLAAGLDDAIDARRRAAA
jgi:4-hydroxy-tetrahydrodipicolinate synthase